MFTSRGFATGCDSCTVFDTDDENRINGGSDLDDSELSGTFGLKGASVFTLLWMWSTCHPKSLVI